MLKLYFKHCKIGHDSHISLQDFFLISQQIKNLKKNSLKKKHFSQLLYANMQNVL